MTADTLLGKISASVRLSELMAWPLDFNVTSKINDGWFQLMPDGGQQAIAQDGTGGIFALRGPGSGENRPVLFVSSEGQAGLIAATLADALQLIVALPYWRSCLKFSGGGRLEEMQRAVPYLEREIREDEPDIDELRGELFDGLGLVEPVNAMERLHTHLSKTSSRFQVLSDDGSQFVGLFGGFTVEDNPTWR